MSYMTISLNNKVRREIDMDYTKDDYHKTRHPEFIADRELFHAWSFFADDAYFLQAKKGDKVLEFGGGLGWNLVTTCKRSIVYMLEPSSYGREKAKENGIEAVEDLSELEKASFDIILCRHVLEHLENPLETLKKLKEYLKPSGEVVLVVPCEKISEMPIQHEIDHHLYNWSPRNLGNLVQRAGYFQICTMNIMVHAGSYFFFIGC